jgi:hypothetical protein
MSISSSVVGSGSEEEVIAIVGALFSRDLLPICVALSDYIIEKHSDKKMDNIVCFPSLDEFVQVINMLYIGPTLVTHAKPQTTTKPIRPLSLFSHRVVYDVVASVRWNVKKYLKNLLSYFSRGSLYNFSDRLTCVFLICHIGIAIALWQNYLYLAFHVQTWAQCPKHLARI